MWLSWTIKEQASVLRDASRTLYIRRKLKKGGDKMRIKVKFGDTGFSLKMTLKQWIRYLIYK